MKLSSNTWRIEKKLFGHSTSLKAENAVESDLLQGLHAVMERTTPAGDLEFISEDRGQGFAQLVFHDSIESPS